MDEIIQIQCPRDGAILSVKNRPDIETKSVTCPVCKVSSPFTQYKRIVPGKPSPQEEHTEYPGQQTKAGHDSHAASGETEMKTGGNYTLGRLVVVDTGQCYPRLNPGRTIVGRKASGSGANFQIETGEQEKRMSREHVLIEVKKVPGKGFVHQISLVKERCNATYVNDTRLEYGDCLILRHGDLIKLPDATVRFEIPDEERTEL